MLTQLTQNQAGSISIDVYHNGTLSAATDVTVLTILTPSGNVLGTNYTTTEGLTTGNYVCSLLAGETTNLGVHTAVWSYVVGGTTYTHTQYFKVVVTAVEGYVTPSEVRAIATYSEITNTTPSDDLLQRYIDKATGIIDAYLGSSLEFAQYNEKIRCVVDKANSGLFIPLKHRPISSITSVSVQTTPTSTINLTTSYFRINETAGYIEYFSSLGTPYSICISDYTASSIIPVANVSYTAGYTEIPDDIKNATVYLVEELYREDNGDGKEISSITIDKYRESYFKGTDSDKSVIGDSKWGTIRKILNKYKQQTVSPGLAGMLG